jgi:hypothetical protein
VGGGGLVNMALNRRVPYNAVSPRVAAQQDDC